MKRVAKKIADHNKKTQTLHKAISRVEKRIKEQNNRSLDYLFLTSHYPF